MAGDLPFEAPLVEMRKKIDELNSLDRKKGSISRTKLPAWKNVTIDWKKRSTLILQQLKKCIWPVISSAQRRWI